MGVLYIISGDDEFAQKAKTKEIIAKLADNGNAEDDSAFEIIDGDTESGKIGEICESLLRAMRTPPFLADHQVIWARNFAGFDLLSSNYKSKGVMGDIAALLTQTLPADQTIIINGAGLDQRKAFAKALKAAGADITICSQIKASDRNFSEVRRKQIQELCQESGKRILPSAMQYLELALGGNSGTLRQELDKLFCYVGDSSDIDLEACRAICSRTPEAVSWNFTNALLERNTSEALNLLDELIKQREPAMRLLAGVSNEYQRLIQVSEAMEALGIAHANSRSFDQIPQDVREANKDNMLLKLHPYRAFKFCEMAQKYRPEELAQKIACILETNRGLVSGLMDERLLLEKMIFILTNRAS